MALYFFMTYATEVVSYYLPFDMEHYGLNTGEVGVATAMFFAAATVAGFFLTRIIDFFKDKTIQVAIFLCIVGLFVTGGIHHAWSYIAGVFIMGLGYGVIQPVIYDKAATIAPPRSATLALSFVMAMNYLAVMICPFIMDMFRHLFHTHSDRFPFFFNAALVFALAAVTWFRRGNFTLGLDESYYKN